MILCQEVEGGQGCWGVAATHQQCARLLAWHFQRWKCAGELDPLLTSCFSLLCCCVVCLACQPTAHNKPFNRSTAETNPTL